MAITVRLPDELGCRLLAEAERRGQDIDRVAAEVLAAGLPGEPLELSGGGA